MKKRRPKGRGQVVKSGRVWAIKFTEGGARKYRGGFLTKDQADQALASAAANIAAGRPAFEERAAAGELIGDLAEPWLDARARMRSVKDDRNRWRKHLAPALAKRRIDEVSPSEVQEVQEEALKTLDPATVERVLYTLSSFYRWAIRRGHVVANPVRAYLASLNPEERRQLRSQHDPTSTPYVERVEDVGRIVRALPRPMNVAYALTATAGLRPGEALAMEWDDVDLTRHTILIRHQVRHGRLGPPKSGKPRRVPMVPGLAALLHDWRARCVSPLVVPPLRAGRPHMGPKSVQTALAEALAALGLPLMTWYQAGRHTFASQWVLAGLDIYRLSLIMGHASVVTTQRYAHLTAKTPAEMLARVDVGML